MILVTLKPLDFPENPENKNCQCDSGVEPTTRMHCPKTVSAFTLNALLQSLHGVMPDTQGTSSEGVETSVEGCGLKWIRVDVEDKRNDAKMDFVPSDCSIISIFNMESIFDEQSPDVLFSL